MGQLIVNLICLALVGFGVFDGTGSASLATAAVAATYLTMPFPQR
jgi:hypothetical protein